MRGELPASGSPFGLPLITSNKSAKSYRRVIGLLMIGSSFLLRGLSIPQVRSRSIGIPQLPLLAFRAVHPNPFAHLVIPEYEKALLLDIQTRRKSVVLRVKAVDQIILETLQPED